MKTKVTKNGFVWLVISKKQAKLIYLNGILDVYCMFDNSESLVTCFRDFSKCSNYGIPVGFLKDLNEQWKTLEK